MFMLVILIRLRGQFGGKWNDVSCNQLTQHIVCTTQLEESSGDVYIGTSGVSFALLIILTVLLLTERRHLGRNFHRLREIEKLQLK